MKEFMTLAEIMEYFDISKDTVMNWQQQGLKAIHTSQKLKFFYCEDIRKFLLKERYEKVTK